MPPGFKAAYRQFVEAGWGSIDGPGAYGGQDLPFTLAAVVIEALGSANMGFSLCSILTPGAIPALIDRKIVGSGKSGAVSVDAVGHLILKKTTKTKKKIR